MTYSHTKRSGVAFVFLGIITLGIYPIAVLSKVRKEVSSLLDGKGVDPQIPFLWAYLLGFFQLKSKSGAEKLAPKAKTNRQSSKRHQRQ